jgi:hypothetical protein
MTGALEVSRLKGRLDATFQRAPPPSADVEIQSDFARYLCVLVSGFLENAIAALILDFAQRRSSREIASFIEYQLDYWTNPNTEKICSLLGSFSADWRTKSEQFLIDERKAGVNSLVALRHKIAHGESVGTSLSQVKEYYATAKKIVDFVAELTV